MSHHNHNSAIRFREVEPSPSQDIPAGTVVEQVVVPWLSNPIGVIVSRPSDKPPDALSWGRVRTLWYFVPADSNALTIQCDTILEDIHIRVRDHYHKVYDSRNAPRGTFIASGDDCEIEDLVIEWAGLTEKWEESGLGERHSFWKDVLWPCAGVRIKIREWEGGGPGLSGTWYRVRTMNSKELREEIAHWFEALVERDKEELEKARQLAEIKKAEKNARKQARREKKP